MVNRLTEGSNMFWESSRMMLPEHKRELIEHRKELNRRKRVELDESEWERISQAVVESLEMRTEIVLRIYYPFESLTVRGVVDRVDQQKGSVMVDGAWYKIKDIEGMGSNE